MTDRIAQGGYFCIEARDAFTNQPILSDEVKIFVNGQAPVLKKEDRYYIFSPVKGDILEVQVESSVYEEKSCVVSLSQPVKEIQLLPDGMVYPFCGTILFLILLYPGDDYRLPDGYHRAEISCNPEEEVRVIINREKWYVLAKEYRGGDTIHIYMSEEKEIKGRYFRIEEKEGMLYEDFIIVDEIGDGCYQMKKNLKGGYSMGSRLYELYHKRADEQGRAEVIVKEE